MAAPPSAFTLSGGSTAAFTTFHNAVNARSSLPATAARSTAASQRALDDGNRNGKWRTLNQPSPPPLAGNGRRHACLAAVTTLSLALVGMGGGLLPGRAAILEADDDDELLERVKRDRKRRLERQGVISSSSKETGYLQELVYKLGKVGQALDNDDLSAASSVLGLNLNAAWLQNVNMAFTKLSSSPEEKIEIDAFNSSLVSLISSVGKKDAESSKLAFVSSASALEKWVTLTGLVGELKGL